MRDGDPDIQLLDDLEEDERWDDLLLRAEAFIARADTDEKRHLGWYFKGTALERTDHQEAVGFLEKTVEEASGKASVMLRRRWAIALSKKKEEEAYAQAREIIDGNFERIEALDAAGETEKTYLRIQNLHARAMVLSNSERLDEAFDTYARAEELCAGRAEFETLRNMVSWSRSYIYFKRNDYQRALEDHRKYIAYKESRGKTPFWSCYQAGKNALGLKDSEQALDWSIRAVDHLETSRQKLYREHTRINSISDKYKIYVQAVKLSAKLHKPDEAFRYMELAKSRTLLELLSQGTGDRETEIGYGLEEESRLGYAACIEGEEVRKLLGEDTALVSYFMGRPWEDCSGRKERGSVVVQGGCSAPVVLELKQDKKRLYRYIDDLFRAINATGNRRARSNPRLFQIIAEKLAEILVEPLLEEGDLRRYRHVIFVPHHSLHYLPIHALPGLDGRPLVEDVAISYLPSASLLRYWTGKGGRRTETRVLLVAPDVGLAHAEDEAGELRALFAGKGWDVKILRGEEACRMRVLEEMPGCGVVHFATHAEFDAKNPMLSRIRLSGSDQISAQDIREMGINWLAGNQLTTIAACETGVQAIRSGDEGMGLIRSFITAGVSSLLVSSWAVPDDSTQELMGAFYRSWLEGMRKDLALQQAMGKVREAKEGMIHWAGFKLIGR